MKRIMQLFGSLLVLLAVSACSDDIAEEVYQQEKQQAEKKTSTLTINLENAGEQEGLILAALAENPFNEQGISKEIGEEDFLINKTIEGNPTVFDDLMDFYKQTLYFNVYQKTGEAYTPVTHLGNQLQYEVVPGSVEKTIDLAASPQEVIRKTELTVAIAPEYNGKNLYLVKESTRSTFEQTLQAGGTPTEDLYLAMATAEEGTASITIDSPKNTDTYWIYLLQPEEGLPYLKRNTEIGYDTDEQVSLAFAKEVKKQIQVTAIYLMGEEGSQTEEAFAQKEIYLISKNNWDAVKNFVETTHGNPQPGTYVDCQTTNREGKATFELFCTETQQDYVVYAPKWNTEYYDNYKEANVTITPESTVESVEIKYPYIPPTGEGGGGIDKTVTFTVNIPSVPPGFISPAPNVYILKDASMLSSAVNKVMVGSYDVEGLVYATANTIPGGSATIEAEVNTGKKFAVFIAGMYQWVPAYIAKEIDASTISGNTYEVVLNENDEPKYPN